MFCNGLATCPTVVRRRSSRWETTHTHSYILCFRFLQVGDMSNGGKETLFSMGDDTPLAVLSESPRTLYDYFKQRFAQVTLYISYIYVYIYIYIYIYMCVCVCVCVLQMYVYIYMYVDGYR